MSALHQAIPGLKKRAHRRASPMARRQTITGLLFLSPWLIGFFAFTLLPMVASLALSFTSYNLIKPEETRFIGLGNYLRLANDPAVGLALGVTLKFLILSVPLSILVPLLLAALMNSRHLLARPFFRTLFYMPTVLPFIATVYIWQGVLNDKTGWLNKALEALGLAGPQWLTSAVWIIPALLLVNLWGIGNTFLTLLAGIQGVPTELYEAARVDGAGPVTIFRHVTVPLISPVIFYNLTLSLIATFQYFLVPYVLVPGPNGEPGRSTFFYNLYLFKSFFTYQDMAYGATLAWVLFIIVLAVTAALFGSARYWVYYAGEERR